MPQQTESEKYLDQPACALLAAAGFSVPTNHRNAWRLFVALGDELFERECLSAAAVREMTAEQRDALKESVLDRLAAHR